MSKLNLDETIPAAFRDARNFRGAIATETPTETVLEEVMTTPATPGSPTQSLADIQAAVTKTVSDMFAQQNNQQAIAGKMVELTQDANDAHAEAAKQKKMADDKDELFKKAKADLEVANTELAEAKKNLKAAKDKNEVDEKTNTQLGVANTHLTEEVNTLKASSTVTTREKAIADAKIPVEHPFKGRAIAHEKGTFKMSDADFQVGLADLVALLPKGDAAATGAGGTAAPAAAGTAAGTPAPAAAGVTGGVTEPAAASAPNPPDMGAAGIAALAASAVQPPGPLAQTTGRANYAKLFPCTK